MKKTLLLLLALVLVFALCACGEGEQTPTPSDTPTEAPTQAPTQAPSECNHVWVDATCTAAKTCSVCAATEGNPADHTWADATCTTPKTCSVCAATEGGTVPHSWVDATCAAPKTCSVCSATQGSAAGHNMVDGACSVCGTPDPTAPFSGNSWTVYFERGTDPDCPDYGEILAVLTINCERGFYAYKEYYSNVEYDINNNGSTTFNGKTYYDFWYSSEMGGYEIKSDDGNTVSILLQRGYEVTLTLTRKSATQFTITSSTRPQDIPEGLVLEKE